MESAEKQANPLTFNVMDLAVNINNKRYSAMYIQKEAINIVKKKKKTHTDVEESFRGNHNA